MFARTLILVLAGAALVGCSKSEPPAAPKTAAAPRAATATPAPARTGEIDEGLKERLARQDAAAKMFERNVLQPPPPRVPDPPPAVAAAAAPQPAASALPPRVPASRPAEPPKTEPAKVAARAEPPTAAAAVPAPISPSPASPSPASPPPLAPRTELAAARPAPAPAQAALRLVSRVDPDFPREAVQAGVDQGNVKARMTLDAGGNVTRVEIVDANPRRVFDRAVVRALSQWRYSDGSAGRTVDMEIAFRR